MTKYQPGQSGNPMGKPKGVLNKRTQLSKLLEPHAEALINKAVELALDGDSNALRLCIERLLPKAKDEPTNIVFPVFDTASSSAEEIGKEMLRALSGKEISLDQAKTSLHILKVCGENAPLSENDPDIQRLMEYVNKFRKEY